MPCHHISLESPKHKDGCSAFDVAEVLFSGPSCSVYFLFYLAGENKQPTNTVENGHAKIKAKACVQV